MFQYWNGFEIDGSSTSYNVVSTERQLIPEVLRYFLNLKIVDRQAKLSFGESEADKQTFDWEDINRVCEKAANTATQTIFLSATCVHPDQLFYQVRRELFTLSLTRPGAECKSQNYVHPTVSPLYQPALGVCFSVSFKDNNQGVKDYQPQGLVFNKQALVNQIAGPHFTIDLICGPGFIYEYAAYIMTKLATRFPEIGIDGGIDCAGGFVDGCTYASNLYAYERILVGTGEVVAPLQCLLDNHIIVPTTPSGKYGRELVPVEKLTLYHACNIKQALDEYLDVAGKIVKGLIGERKNFSVEQYGEWVGKLASITALRDYDFSYYCTCSVNFQESVAAITCVKENNEIALEARVPSALRNAFLKQLVDIGLK